MKKLIVFVILCLAACSFVSAQSKFPELDKIKQIKLLESTREDVKKIFSDDDEESEGNYYSTENFYIVFSYAGGHCSEDDDEEWNVAEGKVTEINATIKNSDEPKKFKVDLSKLDRIKSYEDDEDDKNAEENADDYIYYDKEKGISYGLSDGEIEYIKFTPLEKNYPALCNNKSLREFKSTKEWFLNKIKDRPHIETGLIRSLSNVNDLTLSTEEITADCIIKDLPETKISSDYAKIAIETKAESNDPIDVLTYNYTVSRGKIIGTGASVVWDLTGVAPGTYTITAGVDNGCGVCGTTKTKEVVIKAPDCSQK